MADNLTPLPNPGDSDYPTDNDKIAAIEAERARRKRVEQQKKRKNGIVVPGRGPGFVDKTKTKTEEKKPADKRTPTQILAEQTAVRTSGTPKIQEVTFAKNVQSAINTYGKNPSEENSKRVDDAKKAYKEKFGKEYGVKPAPATTGTMRPSNTIAKAAQPGASVTTGGAVPAVDTSNVNPNSPLVQMYIKMGMTKEQAMSAVALSNLDSGNGNNGGGGGGTPSKTVSTQYTKKVYTEDEFVPVANSVARSLLGRMLSDDEIKRALSEANVESLKSPTKTVTTTRYKGNTSSTSTSTTSGGFDVQGSLQKKIGETAESQAYTTNDVFNGAMRILADRIG